MLCAEVADMNEWLNADGRPYDPNPALASWQAGDASAGRELSEHLYHQGTVNSASYAAVEGIVSMIAGAETPDWNAYALLASIEEGRLIAANPAMPSELEVPYRDAWKRVLPKALADLTDASDDPTVRSILAVIAYAKGQHSIAAITLCTEDERLEMLGTA
jgi:hypothetical protein